MSRLFSYEFIQSKFNMIVSISKEVCEQAKKNGPYDNGRITMNVNYLFTRIFGTIIIRCFFGDIHLDRIEGQDPFDFLSGLTEKFIARVLMISSHILQHRLMKYGFRKIDREINQEIQQFHQYVHKMIEQIIEEVKNNPSEKES